MSTYQPKPNSLSIFKNDRKRNEKDPDYSGTLYFEDENGQIVEYYMDCWVNEIRSGQKQGQKYFGGRIKRKDRQPGMADSYGNHDRPLGEHQRSMSYDGPPQQKRGVGPGDYSGPSAPRRGDFRDTPVDDDSIPF